MFPLMADEAESEIRDDLVVPEPVPKCRGRHYSARDRMSFRPLGAQADVVLKPAHDALWSRYASCPGHRSRHSSVGEGYDARAHMRAEAGHPSTNAYRKDFHRMDSHGPEPRVRTACP